MFIALLCLSITKISGETSEKEESLPSVAVSRLFSSPLGVQRVSSEKKNDGILGIYNSAV